VKFNLFNNNDRKLNEENDKIVPVKKIFEEKLSKKV
jgi:hypothetical protein